MKWLYKLEYKFGRHYIQKLMTVIVAGMAAVLIADVVIPTISISSLLTLDRSAILSGQVWRLITFIFVPPNASYFFIFFTLYFYWIMGNSLEQYWGGFKLNLYYLLGMIGAIISMFITGAGTNTYLNLSLFLAFATVAPDTTFMLFFILPIKAKWMALAYVGYILYTLIPTFIASPTIGVYLLVALLFSLLNYLVFFGRSMVETVKNQIRMYNNRRNWNRNSRK